MSKRLGKVDLFWIHQGFDVGCGLMDSRRVVAPSDAVATSMASLERGFPSVEHPGEGYVES
jgi:hypothetical protein